MEDNLQESTSSDPPPKMSSFAPGAAIDLLETREALLVEQTLISKRTKEFRHGIRSFPVNIKYVPCESEGCSGVVAPYVLNVVKMVFGIYNTERDGIILAFLTS
nr:ATP-dependent RNA helicase DEAH11, chloroplastic-like [Ipomoea batatas]